MRVTAIDHIVLDVADVERSAAWYHERLGLEVLRLDEWRRKQVSFVSLRISDTTIIDLLERPPTGENMNHVALLVEGVDIDELAAAGELEIESGPADLFGAQGDGRGLYTRDPDGHLVELRTYPSA